MIDPHQIGYDEARTKTFYRELERRAHALPGVQAVSLSFTAPMGFPSHVGPIYVETHPLPPGRQPPVIAFNSIEPAFFDTLRVPLLEGRRFTDADSEMARAVAIVNRAMARKLWPGENPIGKRFSIKSAAGPFVEVVGVAGDGQYFFLSRDLQPYFYLPLDQNYSSFRSLLIRSSVPPESLMTPIQDELRKLEPNLPIFDLRTSEQMVNGIEGLLLFRMAASLAAIMGALGLVLAVMGVYGIVSFAVSGRTQEIGIRMALGAEAPDIEAGCSTGITARAGGPGGWPDRRLGTYAYDGEPVDWHQRHGSTDLCDGRDFVIRGSRRSLLDSGTPRAPSRPDGRFAV
jgi:hypothetical protein